jgi:arylsulfatase A-like enzyme
MIVMDCARSDRWHSPERGAADIGICRKTARTPVFDSLAAGGASLSTTIAETSSTTPCFASLLTGSFSFRHGIAAVGGYTLKTDMPTLAEQLKRAGYNTYAEVTGPLLPAVGLDRGFDEYNYRVAFDFLHTAWGERFLARLRGGQYKPPWLILLHLWELHVERQVLPAYDAPEFGANPYDRSVSSLDSQLGPLMAAANAPGAELLTIMTGDHGEKTTDESYLPGTAVDETRRLYKVDQVGARGVRSAAMLIGPGAMYELRARFQPMLEKFSMRQTPRDLSTSRWRQWRDLLTLLRLSPKLRLRDYFAIRNRDKLTQILSERGALDEHQNRDLVERLIKRMGHERLFDLYIRMWVGQFRKQLDEGHVLHVYDFLTRVPLLLHWPGRIAAGWRSERMVRQVDIGATLVDLLSIDRNDGFSTDGHSFAALLRGAAWDARPAYQSVTGQPRDMTLRGIRTETHRMTFGSLDDLVPRELYDLRSDPAEQNNLAETQSDQCARLRGQAEQMLPPEGVHIERADRVNGEEGRMIEQRLRELGYVE